LIQSFDLERGRAPDPPAPNRVGRAVQRRARGRRAVVGAIGRRREGTAAEVTCTERERLERPMGRALRGRAHSPGGLVV